MLAQGTVLGAYQIVRFLAQGGMAVVYLAVHIRLNRQVALKVLNSDLAGDENLVRRFRREAMLMANMRHPHIVEVYDAGESGGHYYFAMELLTGGSLQNEIDNGGVFRTEKALNVTRQIASALDFAHRHNAIHRDIKPSNILRAHDGRYVLTDFGIALAQNSTRLTKTSLMMGTPAYMSPEQGQGIPVDQRTDLYSLGIVLFAMLSGGLPFQADTPMGVIYKQINQIPPRLNYFRSDMPADMQLFLDRCLTKRREDRFQSAGQMLAEIDRLWRGQPLSFSSAPFRPIQKQDNGQGSGSSLSVLATVALGIVTGLISLVVVAGLASQPSPVPSPALGSTRVALPSSTSLPQPLPKPGQASYAVQSGDTLVGIAARFGVSVDALLRANGLTNAQSLHAGEMLTIPWPEPTPKAISSPPPAANQRLVFTRGDVGCSQVVARYLSDDHENIFSAGGNAEEPSWSPDGARIVVAGGDCNASPRKLIIFDIATGEHRNIFEASSALDPDWGNDGRIYFAQGDKSGSSQLFSIDPQNQVVTDLNREGREPTLSPDRNYLAYMRQINSVWRVYVSKMSGNGLGAECEMPLPAVPGGVYARMPNWVVDSSRKQRIIFNITDANSVSVALGWGEPTMCSAETLLLSGAPVSLARPACNADGFCVANQASSTTNSTRGLHRISPGTGNMWNYIEQLTTNEDYAADIYP